MGQYSNLSGQKIYLNKEIDTQTFNESSGDLHANPSELDIIYAPKMNGMQQSKFIRSNANSKLLDDILRNQTSH